MLGEIPIAVLRAWVGSAYLVASWEINAGSSKSARQSTFLSSRPRMARHRTARDRTSLELWKPGMLLLSGC
jgi:hypothetical protein